jgi:hypothetical protein
MYLTIYKKNKNSRPIKKKTRLMLSLKEITYRDPVVVILPKHNTQKWNLIDEIVIEKH